MAHRRRGYGDRRGMRDEEYARSPESYGGGEEYYGDERRKRLDSRNEGTGAEDDYWVEVDRASNSEEEEQGSEHERRRERRRRRSPGWERGRERGREWRRSPARDRSRRRRRDGSRERSPRSSPVSDSGLGEWNCRCGALNFKRRSTCYRKYCGASRDSAVPAPAGQPAPQAYSAADIPRLAAYSARLYATSPQQRAAYLRYYTDYYTRQLAPGPATEADRANAAAAVAQSALSQMQARAAPAPPPPPPPPPSGSDGRVFPPPEPSAYLYDETSGYYYDPGTGLYYDANTRYYYNNQINQYLYWDAVKFTYSLASSIAPAAASAAAAAVVPPAPVISAPPAEEPPTEGKKKSGDKPDKVKVAKKIAKDMERWAKSMNNKKEAARSNSLPEASSSHSAGTSVSADIGFSVLERRAAPVVASAPAPATPAPAPPPTLVPSYGAGSDSSGDEGETTLDWSKLACLLCKRQFPSRDVMEKHVAMSDLHRQNLEAAGGGYRDRAAERRKKYGEDSEPVVRSARPEPAVISAPREIGEDNVGNRLLRKMGWSAGQGLGREGQGRLGPLEAAPAGPGGLGARRRGIYTAAPGETYQDCVKKLTMARYQDLIGSEGQS